MTDRGISAEIRRSQTFGKLDYRERDLFQGLIERMVDDQGRALAEPALIRSEIWPYDDITLAEVEESLNSLASSDDPFIMIYTVNRKKYLQIINWWKWQRANMFFAHRSIYPAPEGWTDRVRINTKGQRMDIENWDLEGGFDGSQISADAVGSWVKADEAPTQVPTMAPTEVPTQEGARVDIDIDINTKTDTEMTGIDTPGIDNLRARKKIIPLDRAKKAWNQALGDLQREMSRAEFESYIRPLVVTEFDGTKVTVEAGNKYTIDFVSKRGIKKLLEEKVRASLSDPGVMIDLVV